MKYLWLFMFVTVILGCNEVVPGTCRPNTTGGAGGADSWAVGAGVGATTSGDFATDPPMDPLAAGDEADPCEDPAFGKPATQYIDCRKRGLSADACSEVCTAAGAACVSFAGHPYKSGVGTGQLTWCKNGQPTFTCTYTFPNGDGCAKTRTPAGSFWICMYAGGG